MGNPEDKFWANVDRRGPDECWLWLRGKTKSGYGQAWHNKRAQSSHRVAWELVNGPIPKGMELVHRCQQRACVNPAHLLVGFPADKNRVNIPELGIMTFEERFWSYVSRSPEKDGCWLWTGQVIRGYGSIKYLRRPAGAHRVAWLLVKGEIPDGLFVCHDCDQRICVRPDHLFLGTTLDNMQDMVRKGRSAKGDRQGLRLHPGAAARGEQHGRYTHPERTARGERNGSAKLTEEQVREIRRLYATGDFSQTKIGKMFGVCYGNIGRIVRGDNWQHIGESNG